MAINAATCYAVLSIFFSLTVITVFARFYTRLALLRKFSTDDYVLLVGFILIIPYTAIYTLVIRHLFIRPFYLFQLQDLSNVYKYAFMMLPFYLVASMFIKLSIALRILKFCGEARILKWIVIFALVIYLADAIVMVAINFTQCLLPVFTWARPFKVSLSPEHCSDQVVLRNTGWLFSSLTCFLDFTLAIVPVFIVRKLWRTNRRTRVMLSILLSLGSIASLATIARMFYNYKFTSTPTPDSAGNFFLWTYLELSLATIACSVATLKPLAVKIAQLTTTGSFRSRRTHDTTKSEEASGTWSAYIKNFHLGGQPAPSGTSEEEKSQAFSGTTATAPRRQWPPKFSSSNTSPRVLRHPLSFDSMHEPEIDYKQMSEYESRITSPPSTRLSPSATQFSPNSTQFSPNSTQFTATFSDDNSSEEDLVPERQTARVAHYESLEAQIQYALDDEAAPKPAGTAKSKH